jgi:hypothetical protein
LAVEAIVLRPWLFAPVSYWQAIAHSKAFVIDFSLNWSHRIPANRIVLPGPNGLQLFSFPLKGGRKVNATFFSLEFCEKTAWNTQLIRTVQTIYGKSPYYELLMHEWLELLENPSPSFATFFEATFAWQLKRLGFPPIQRLTEPSANSVDYRQMLWNEAAANSPVYQQVFSDKNGFSANVSSLDLLFNLGPSAFSLL